MLVQADTVLIQTRVSVVRESPNSRSGSSNGGSAADDAEVLGVLADCFCVRVASLDNMLPGSGFQMHNHVCRWLKPIAGASKRGMLGVQKQCRVQ
jgi:hypothetical protein